MGDGRLLNMINAGSCNFVIPAQAGIQWGARCVDDGTKDTEKGLPGYAHLRRACWIPACAGMTSQRLAYHFAPNLHIPRPRLTPHPSPLTPHPSPLTHYVLKSKR
ncbi:hypothetical protein GCM10010970_20230 [Silvimonas iriomotensis]|uniref:Uncharacterized protein n=1 Tax=Silvimonas iriomotensis TaxID=449662 RepID=A0ABQ2P9F2_9NEIS|nr:hypothetical protein GCM10010970_20230 [Silvimonas iriomotensis]